MIQPPLMKLSISGLPVDACPPWTASAAGEAPGAVIPDAVEGVWPGIGAIPGVLGAVAGPGAVGASPGAGAPGIAPAGAVAPGIAPAGAVMPGMVPGGAVVAGIAGSVGAPTAGVPAGGGGCVWANEVTANRRELTVAVVSSFFIGTSGRLRDQPGEVG